MAKLRNWNFNDAKGYFGTDFDYIVIIDTDLHDYIDIDGFCSSFNLDEEWDMIAANGVHKNSNYYYDAFALRMLDEPDDINLIYPNFKNYYGRDYKWVDKLYVFESFYKVKSAFSGASILKHDIFKRDKLWEEDIPYDM